LPLLLQFLAKRDKLYVPATSPQLVLFFEQGDPFSLLVVIIHWWIVVPSGLGPVRCGACSGKV
jgi:hypothetical protein